MPNGFKYLSNVNEYDCQSNGGSPTTVTYLNECGLTTTISCPVSPARSLSFYAVQITNSTGSNVQILNSPVLINQASPFGLNGPDVGMDNNTIKDNLIVLAINSRAYGPTTETGYYAGIDPPTQGYTVYSMRSGCLAYNVQTANNDTTLIGIINSYGAGVTTIYGALDWAINQKWISVLNKNYGNIYTDYLYFCIDPSFSTSYPRSGTTAYSIASYPNWSGVSTTAVMVNGTFNWNDSIGGGSWLNSGTNNLYFSAITSFYGSSEFTIDFWFIPDQNDSNDVLFITNNYGLASYGIKITTTLFDQDNSKIEVFIKYSGTEIGGLFVIASTTIWSNIVLCYDGFNIKLYRNNVYVDLIEDIAGDYTTSSFRYAGDGVSGAVLGPISTLKVYYKDLSSISGALTQNYNAVSGQYV